MANRGGTDLVLDGSSDPPVLWVAHPDRRTRLLRLADKGDRFEAEAIGVQSAEDWAGESADYLAADPTCDAVYVRRGPNAIVRFDGTTGQATTMTWPVRPVNTLLHRG